MNPIENLWGYLAHRVYSSGNYSSKQALFEALQKEWLSIPPSVLETLYVSLPHRLDLVRKARGFPTRY